MRHNLVQARKALNKTQEEVADAIGISRCFYTQIESGVRNPSWAVAQRIEQYFEQPVGKLLASKSDDEAAVTVSPQAQAS